MTYLAIAFFLAFAWNLYSAGNLPLCPDEDCEGHKETMRDCYVRLGISAVCLALGFTTLGLA